MMERESSSTPYSLNTARRKATLPEVKSAAVHGIDLASGKPDGLRDALPISNASGC
jgi:hypothetical protein